jgi:alpha,alpha-trehalose phosphorylase
MCGDAFTDEQKARDFAYYEPLTVRDSSLSACTQAVVAAEVGQLELAHEYLAEAALMDLRDLERNTRDGMHMASLAGAWIALIQGFGGMRQTPDGLTFAPRLPNGFSRLRFHMRYRGRLLRVTVTRHEATYELEDGDQLIIRHFGAEVTVREKATRQKIPAIQNAPRPHQPKGREPITHRD